jgi:hypothetical protein
LCMRMCVCTAFEGQDYYYNYCERLPLSSMCE